MKNKKEQSYPPIRYPNKKGVSEESLLAEKSKYKFTDISSLNRDSFGYEDNLDMCIHLKTINILC